jgi:hypothetical protein
MDNDSTVHWAHNYGYNGTTTGVSSSTTDNRSEYVYAKPRFVSPPPIPATGAPWAAATPPWELGDALTLARGSPARYAGTDPGLVAGTAGPIIAGIRRTATSAGS